MTHTSHSLLDRLQGSSSESAWRELVDLYAPLVDAPFLCQPKLKKVSQGEYTRIS